MFVSKYSRVMFMVGGGGDVPKRAKEKRNAREGRGVYIVGGCGSAD
jgi:hypothetical protein